MFGTARDRQAGATYLTPHLPLKTKASSKLLLALHLFIVLVKFLE